MKINDIFIKIKDKLLFLYDKNKKLFFIFIFVILAVIVLMFYQNPILKSENSITIDNHKIQTNSYIDKLELKIESMLKNISSVNQVSVMVMAESTEIKNYLTQSESTKTTNSSGDSEIIKEEIIYEKNGSSQTPVVISVTYPKIKGVFIVLNKIDASTKVSIQNAVAGVLNIDTTSIFILQDR